MNILLVSLGFIFGFIVGVIVLALCYAWNVTANNRVLGIDDRVGYSRFIDKKDFVIQEINKASNKLK